MRTRRFVIPTGCLLAVLTVCAAAVAQTQGRPAQPAHPNVRIAPLVMQTQSPNTTLLTQPRAVRIGQYPMPIARTDVSRFNMPITGGDPASYPIRIIRPEGDTIAFETAPPVGVPVEPKLLEPVRLKMTPARPSVSK